MATVYEAQCLGGDFQQRIIAFPVYGYRLEEAPDVHNVGATGLVS